MIFTPSLLAGAFIIDVQRIEDERGFFGRSFCRDEFTAHGLKTEVAQCNISCNRFRGTVRGMHFQNPPHAEAKLVRCSRGAIQDIIVDLRPDSATCYRWEAVELTQDNCRMLYIPEGFAHGFQTLADDSEVFYQMFHSFASHCADGIRWDDPAISIRWPLPVTLISEKDCSYPDWSGRL